MYAKLLTSIYHSYQNSCPIVNGKLYKLNYKPRNNRILVHSNIKSMAIHCISLLHTPLTSNPKSKCTNISFVYSRYITYMTVMDICYAAFLCFVILMDYIEALLLNMQLIQMQTNCTTPDKIVNFSDIIDTPLGICPVFCRTSRYRFPHLNRNTFKRFCYSGTLLTYKPSNEPSNEQRRSFDRENTP